MKRERCVKCGEEMGEGDWYRTPVGYMCVMCMRILMDWAEDQRRTGKLEGTFRKFWPEREKQNQ